MHAIHLCAGVSALLTLMGATASAAPADPADASVSVPAIPYESVLTPYQTPADEAEAPDAVWRSANQAVTNAGGHTHMTNTPANESVAEPMVNPQAHSIERGKGRTMPAPANKQSPVPETMLKSGKKASALHMPHNHEKGH